MARKKEVVPFAGFASDVLEIIEQGVMQFRDDEDRWHLGASLIGADCPRYLWYVFRWAYTQEPEPRMVRLWARGDREEPVFIELLRQAGVIVMDRDEETGKQFRVSDHNGHFGGSLDALLFGLPRDPHDWLLGEFKTHNEKSFNQLFAEGVRSAKFQHWVQMQVYMRKRGLRRALYCAVCKNDDRLYFEFVDLDIPEADKYIARAGWIIGLEEPPAGVSIDPTSWECSWCDAHSVCHGREMPRANCRTCAHITPTSNGSWHCTYHNVVFIKPTDDTPSPMLQGCAAHVFNPGIMHRTIEYLGAYDEHHARFAFPDGREIVNGPHHTRSIDIALITE